MKLEPYTQELQQEGVEVVYSPYVLSVKDYIREFSKYFSVVILSRPHIAIKYIDTVKSSCSKARIIYDTVDLAFLRESRRAKIENNEKLLEEAEKLKSMNLYLSRNSDLTLVVSQIEKSLLLKENPSLNVGIVSIIQRIENPQKSFSERKGILFVGGFDHLPNVDAVIFFVKEIFPVMKQRLPDLTFCIAGSNPPEHVLALKSSHVIVTGYVRDLTSYFESSRVFVAPLRYGAGVKGKINHSMSHGLPVVTTSIGAEGIELTGDSDVLIADEPEEFAEKVVRLYTDENLWNELSQNSLRNVEKHYSFEAAKEKLKELISKPLSGSADNVLRNSQDPQPPSFGQGKMAMKELKKTGAIGREQFIGQLNVIKKDLEKTVSFYPYSIQGNLIHLDNLLHDANLSTEDVLASTTVNDIGGADGDLAFYCEFLGAKKVNLIDYAPANFNQLTGAMNLKEVLGSKVNIIDTDLNTIEGWQNIEQTRLNICLGTLYHLQNPFLALSQLSKKSKYLLLSTKVFDLLDGKDFSSSGIAYFYYPGECNKDSTNYWCFTDECLKRLIDRSGWVIVAYKRVGCDKIADPVDSHKDGRAFAYLKSKFEC
jgi:glycosyltransferase involved in cell wall biosynthesis